MLQIIFQVKTTIGKKFKFVDYTWNWSKVYLMEENFKLESQAGLYTEEQS